VVELGILSLGDLQRDQRTGRRHRPADRMAEILGYAVLADQLGLEVFAVGEHHNPEFFISSPAVALAAVAARTTGIRLTSATTLLGVADPVRVYEDFASLDVISRGRAEITVGRSAFAEPFALFGYDTADYDALFAEKLGLLLDIRAAQTVTWSGRFRPPLDAAAVVPRAVQDPLPVWVGVGGSPDSAERAGGWACRSCWATSAARWHTCGRWWTLTAGPGTGPGIPAPSRSPSPPTFTPAPTRSGRARSTPITTSTCVPKGQADVASW
jgi:alkanesulfonate monooxygenase SsuD/methylene tetrahydromethanopterin reductase-like flavin-dependent oxidoreductase (luciferase family)